MKGLRFYSAQLCLIQVPALVFLQALLNYQNPKVIKLWFCDWGAIFVTANFDSLYMVIGVSFAMWLYITVEGAVWSPGWLLAPVHSPVDGNRWLVHGEGRDRSWVSDSGPAPVASCRVPSSVPLPTPPGQKVKGLEPTPLLIPANRRPLEVQHDFIMHNDQAL